MASKSVDEVDVDLDAVAAGRRAHDGADALRGAATSTDDPAELARRHVHLQDGAAAPLLRVDSHGVGLVDEAAHDVVEHRGGGRRGHLVDVVAVVDSVTSSALWTSSTSLMMQPFS